MSEDKNKESRNEQIEKYLAEKYRFRFNTIKSRTEWQREQSESFRPVTKFHLNSIRRELDNAKGIVTSTDNLRMILESDFAPSVNPVQEYFNTLDWEFEGFMDMLAYQTLHGSADLVDNVCVLNSVSNLAKATGFLRSQQKVYSLLDNDAAGRKALAEVQKLGVEVIDKSSLYSGFKDMNDYLIARNRELQQPRVKIKF